MIGLLSTDLDFTRYLKTVNVGRAIHERPSMSYEQKLIREYDAETKQLLAQIRGEQIRRSN